VNVGYYSPKLPDVGDENVKYFASACWQPGWHWSSSADDGGTGRRLPYAAVKPCQFAYIYYIIHFLSKIFTDFWDRWMCSWYPVGIWIKIDIYKVKIASNFVLMEWKFPRGLASDPPPTGNTWHRVVYAIFNDGRFGEAQRWRWSLCGLAW